MNSKKAAVIDGNCLVYRCFFATYKQLEYYLSKKIEPVNALKLFLLLILNIIKNNDYDYFLIAFDHSQKTFRKSKLEEYKANRKPMPDHLKKQLTLIIQALNELNLQYLSMENIEADDIIGSYAKLMANNDIEVDIYSSDKDMLQLVGKNINLNFIKKGISEILKYTVTNFEELSNGLKPEQIPDFKAIAGDNSDNLSGIKGIGKKTAIKLLLKFQSFDNIYNNLDQIPERIREFLINNKNTGKLCQELATIKTNCLNKYHVDSFIKKPINLNKLKEIIKKYHFQGFEKFFENQESFF